jgi:hypothetical protein
VGRRGRGRGVVGRNGPNNVSTYEYTNKKKKLFEEEYIKRKKKNTKYV